MGTGTRGDLARAAASAHRRRAGPGGRQARGGTEDRARRPARVRRKLPGELGRRRAREHLRREASDLVDSQIGRARGDLQYRLAEAGRALARAVERRYADATSRMRSALQAAGELRNASGTAAVEKERELSEREVAAQHVLALLEEAGKTSV